MSLSSQVLFVAFASSWTVYAVSVDSLVLLVSSAADVVCAVLLSLAVLLHSRDRSVLTVLSSLWLLAVFGLLMGLLVLSGQAVFVLVFSALLCIRWLPQIVESVRWMLSDRHAGGVSLSGSVWGLVMCLGWALWGLWPAVLPSAYGVDVPNIIWGSTGVLSFTLQLVLVRHRVRS